MFCSCILLLGSFFPASDFKHDAVAPPIWITPLCSNVNKYWWCIINKVDMNGLCHPSHYSLSWFLEWPRSSVCNYGSQNAVGAESSKFVAMASVRYLCATYLDPFICLYLFACDSLQDYSIQASKQLSLGEVFASWHKYSNNLLLCSDKLRGPLILNAKANILHLIS